METNFFPDEADQKLFRDFYLRKYEHHRPDVIITVGSSPLRFVKEERHKHFAGIPVVFCEANGLEEDFKHEPGFTGVTMGIEAATTIDAALQLLPRTRQLFVVSGGISPFDRQEEKKVKEQLEDYSSRVDIIYLSGLAMPVLVKRLNSLPEGSIVLVTSFGRGADGANYSSREAGPLISSAANAPVFSLFDVFIGHGEVGGNLSKLRAQGTIAASAALKILDGVNPDDIPVAEAPNEFVFDWPALKRWRIKESNLPPGSIIVNRQLTVWELYKRYIISGIALFLAETLLIFALVWQRARAIKAETEQRRTEQAIRESEKRFRLVANTAPVMIWMSGTDKKCDYFNKPWLDFTGRPLEAELGDGWAEGVHPDDSNGCLQTYTEAFDRKESFEMYYRLRRHDGEYRWLLDNGVPRFNPDGTFAGYIGSCLDITDRKLAEESLATIGRRLIEAHEEERTWISRELHDDINQRLALLAIDLERWSHDASTNEVTELVRHTRARITEIAQDVQGLSHRLHSSKLDYLGLATAAKSFCRELSEKTKVEIVFGDAGIPRTLSKEVSLCLFRVLQEGLQNAVKHSGVRSFTVDLQGTEESIELTVADTGNGFEEQDAFTRHGLGLISMRERLQLVNGELSVKSKPGAGTTIRARVPLKTDGYRAMAG